MATKTIKITTKIEARHCTEFTVFKCLIAFQAKVDVQFLDYSFHSYFIESLVLSVCFLINSCLKLYFLD